MNHPRAHESPRYGYRETAAGLRDQRRDADQPREELRAQPNSEPRPSHLHDHQRPRDALRAEAARHIPGSSPSPHSRIRHAASQITISPGWTPASYNITLRPRGRPPYYLNGPFTHV